MTMIKYAAWIYCGLSGLAIAFFMLAGYNNYPRKNSGKYPAKKRPTPVAPRIVMYRDGSRLS